MNKLWCQIIPEKLGKKPIIIKEDCLSEMLNGLTDIIKAAEEKLKDLYNNCCADWNKQEEAAQGSPTIYDKEIEVRCEKFKIPNTLSIGDPILGFYNIRGDETIINEYKKKSL